MTFWDMILITLSSFSRPALMAGPPDTTCYWLLEEILSSDWLWLPETQTGRGLRGRVCPRACRPQRDQNPGDLGWNKRVCWIVRNCFIFCSHRILMFKVFISRLFRFYWLIFKTQCSVSIDKNYTNRFYSFRSARLVPASLILVITRDACPAQDNVTEFYNQRSGNHDQGVWRVTVLHYSLSTRSNHQHGTFSDFCILHDPHFASREFTGFR